MANAGTSELSYVCQPSDCDFRCCVEDRCGRSLFECQDAVIVFWISLGVLIVFLGALVVCWRVYMAANNSRTAADKAVPVEAGQSMHEQSANLSGIKAQEHSLGLNPTPDPKLSTTIDKMHNPNDQSVRKVTVADPGHVQGTGSEFVVSSPPDRNPLHTNGLSPAVDSKDDLNLVKELELMNHQALARRVEDRKESNFVVINVTSGEEGQKEEPRPKGSADSKRIVLVPREPLPANEIALDQFQFSPHHETDEGCRSEAYRREKSLSITNDLRGVGPMASKPLQLPHLKSFSVSQGESGRPMNV